MENIAGDMKKNQFSINTNRNFLAHLKIKNWTICMVFKTTHSEVAVSVNK